jgi:hypothetical protein
VERFIAWGTACEADPRDNEKFLSNQETPVYGSSLPDTFLGSTRNDLTRENTFGERIKIEGKNATHLLACEKGGIGGDYLHKHLGVQYLRDRACLSERCLCRGDPPDRSEDVCRDGCTSLLDAQKEDKQQAIDPI